MLSVCFPRFVGGTPNTVAVTKQAILHILRKNGIERREHKKGADVEEDIIEMYLNGSTIAEIGPVFNMSNTPIRRILQKHGIECKLYVPMEHEKNRLKKRVYHFNEGYFESIDKDEKAYWMAFIASDGTIGETKVQIKLKRGDREHLKKFLDCIQADYQIKDSISYPNFKNGSKEGYEQSFIEICSIKMAKSLRKQLKLENSPTTKTYLLTYPDLPWHLQKGFIRGMLDGDGCIQYYSNTSASVTFYGTKEMCEGIRDTVVELCNLPWREVKQKEKHLYQVRWGGRLQGNYLLNWLYEDADVYLERKYQQFLQIPKGDFKDRIDISDIQHLIRQRRLELGLTRKDLARKCGCSPSYINAIENNQRLKVAKEYVINMLHILGIEKQDI